MKLANGETIIQHFEKWAAPQLAMEGDKIGLMVGTLKKQVKKVMVALDVLENVIDEAIEKQVDFIIAHHPLIYRPLTNIDVDSAHGRIVAKAMKHDITIYAAHTNLDIAKGGVNDMMARALGLKETKVLAPTKTSALKKVAVFVPHSHVDSVREAMSQAGAGHIGNYSHCTFNSDGIGTFKPEEGTNPYIGKQGELEKVEEVKVETIVPVERVNRVVQALIKAHPYEEPAYDIYPLDNEGEVFGLGRIGTLEKPMKLVDFAEHVKRVFDVKGARVVGDLDASVKTVAVVGGDGNKYVPIALQKGADVIVTGDVYYHVAHDAMMAGLHIVDPGHNVEKIMKEGVKAYLEQFLKENGYETTVIVSEENTDPFQFV